VGVRVAGVECAVENMVVGWFVVWLLLGHVGVVTHEASLVQHHCIVVVG
jgi:hypothetical protein